MNTRKIPLPDLPAIPLQNNEPVFREPWEARIFAIVVSLHDQGAFKWEVFQKLLIDEISRTESTGDVRDYYENWFAAAEKLIHSLDILQPGEVDAEVAALRPDDRTVILSKR